MPCLQVRMNGDADKVKIVVGADMASFMAAVKAKFELEDTAKLRLYLSEDRIEVRPKQVKLHMYTHR